jgi:quinolinate synthase
MEANMPIAGIYGPDDFARPIEVRPTLPARRPTFVKDRDALPMPQLEWTNEVERATAHLYERVKNVIPPVEWPFMAPYVKAINELKAARDAVILAHNYQTPEIFHCVADIVGDSLQLAVEATKVKAGTIIQCGFARRLLARLQHHRRRRAASGRAISRRACCGLCQHLG